MNGMSQASTSVRADAVAPIAVYTPPSAPLPATTSLKTGTSYATNGAASFATRIVRQSKRRAIVSCRSRIVSGPSRSPALFRPPKRVARPPARIAIVHPASPLELRDAGRLAGMILEKIDHSLTIAVVLGMFEHFMALARTAERRLQDLADACLRAIGHQHQPIRQIERFVDVVSHHDDNLSILFPCPQQRVLKVETRQGV